MPTPRINLNGFVKFADAPANLRGRQVEQARRQLSTLYAVEGDFWKRMRDAVYTDRKTSRDGAALLDAVAAAPSKRRPSYQAIADKWPGIARRWRESAFQMPVASTVAASGLEIRVKPTFRELRGDGVVEDVAVWMNLEEPDADAIHGALRLLARADGAPDAVATFVDARRGVAWSGTADEFADWDEWISAEAADFVRRWEAGDREGS